MQVSFSMGGLVVTVASGFFVLRSREEKATLKSKYEQVYAAASQMYATPHSHGRSRYFGCSSNQAIKAVPLPLCARHLTPAKQQKWQAATTPVGAAFTIWQGVCGLVL